MIQLETLDINQHGFDKRDFEEYIANYDNNIKYKEIKSNDIIMRDNDKMLETTKINVPTTPTSSKVSQSDGSAVSHDTSPSSVEEVDDTSTNGQTGLARNSTFSYLTIVNKVKESRTVDGLTRSSSSIQLQTSKDLPLLPAGENKIEVDDHSINTNTESNDLNNSIQDETKSGIIIDDISRDGGISLISNSNDRPLLSASTKIVEEVPKLKNSITFSGKRSGDTLQFEEIKRAPTNDRRHSSPLSPTQRIRRSVEIDPKHVDNSIPSRIITPSRYSFPVYSGSANSIPHVSRNSTSLEITRMRNSVLSKKGRKKRLDSVEDDKVLVGNKISEGHVNFVLAYNMLTGIRVAVSRCSGVMEKLSDKDFESTKKLTFNLDGSELTPSSKYDFKFKDYCPEVFRELRSLFGLDPADYLISITGKYILSELTSPGKSGSFFYYSRDYRFIIKTVHHSEHKQLRKILKEYYKHVKENPNTLVSQFYGLHRVKMPHSINGRRKIHFIVMNNLFPPHRDIHLKYDLKGSTWGRITKYKEGEDLSNKTLKDLNWLERHDRLKFGPNKRKLFFDQLESDVKFLKNINVMDYSLLLGVHDVKQRNTFDLPQKLSVFDPKSADPYELIHTNPRYIDRVNDLPSNVFPGRMKYVFYGHDGGIRATNENNEPLSEIYYLGIIDCLTSYSLKKRLETFWRVLGHSRSSISAVPAAEYGNRFLNFIKKGTGPEKLKDD